MAKVNLNKEVYNKQQVENTINTNFTQLVIPVPPSLDTPTITIDQFFNYYSQLFYQIPKLGDINSHSYLVKTSGEYIGSTENDDVIQALIEEINILRQQNLDLQNQIASQSLTSIQETLNNING